MVLEIINAGLGLFNSALSAIRGTQEIVQKMGGAPDDEARLALKARLSDLMDQVLTLQQAYATLSDINRAQAEENRMLKQELAELKAFDARADEFRLKQIAPGSFVYVKQTAGSAEEADACFCAKCFQNRKASLIQFEKHDYGSDVLLCQECGSRVHKTVDRGPAVIVGRVRPDPFFEI